MQLKRPLYFEPMANENKLKSMPNTYVYNMSMALSNQFEVVNYGKKVRGGVLNIVFKYFFKSNIFYLNWVEHYELFNAIMLVLFFPVSKLFKKKIIWTQHNQHAHAGATWLNSFLDWFLTKYSDYIVVHTKESYKILNASMDDKRIICFFHPFANSNVEIPGSRDKKYDLLIWGTIRKSKGVNVFLKFLKENNRLTSYKIKIIGKFESEDDFKNAEMEFSSPTIHIENRFINNDELNELHREAKYILFPYLGTSILNSAALVNSLPKGTPVIGPDIGAFKELGELGLINTFNKFEDILLYLDSSKDLVYPYDQIASFCAEHTFNKFSEFLNQHLN